MSTSSRSPRWHTLHVQSASTSGSTPPPTAAASISAKARACSSSCALSATKRSSSPSCRRRLSATGIESHLAPSTRCSIRKKGSLQFGQLFACAAHEEIHWRQKECPQGRIPSEAASTDPRHTEHPYMLRSHAPPAPGDSSGEGIPTCCYY